MYVYFQSNYEITYFEITITMNINSHISTSSAALFFEHSPTLLFLDSLDELLKNGEDLWDTDYYLCDEINGDYEEEEVEGFEEEVMGLVEDLKFLGKV